jgi:hypothetical protein
MENNVRGTDVLYNWTPDKMVEVVLAQPDDFLKIRETLTRIGIASKKDNTLVQSCHLLHKRGKYYIVHFKEMFIIDGRESNLTVSDVERRNLIVSLLIDWGLLKVANDKLIALKAPMSSVRIIPFKEKNEWTLQSKYTLGNKGYTPKSA